MQKVELEKKIKNEYKKQKVAQFIEAGVDKELAKIMADAMEFAEVL